MNFPFGNLAILSEDKFCDRKLYYIKYNSFVSLPPDVPIPTCIEVGISFTFPSKVF